MRARTWAMLLASIVAGCDGGPGIAPARAPIIAGHLATSAEVGATVALVDPYDSFPFCTGTLVSPDVVLTAAHCLLGEPPAGSEEYGPPVSPSDVQVVVDAIDPMTASSAQHYAARSIHVHEAFPAPPPYADEVLTGEHDVAAIVLARPVVGIVPVPILPAGAIAAELAPGRMLTAAGYGVTDRAGVGDNTQLHVADVPLVRHSDDELVAGVTGGSDTCYGDSGGPLYVGSHEGLRVVGITSRAADFTTELCDGGSVFTIPSAYLAWLEAATGETLSVASSDPPPPAAVDAGAAPPGRSDAGVPSARRDAGERGMPSSPDRHVSGAVSGGCTVTGGAGSRASVAGAWLSAVVAMSVLRRRRRARAR